MSPGGNRRLFLQLLLGFPYRSQLRLGEDHGRDSVVIDVAVTGNEPLNARNPFLLRLVGQHRTADDIANRVEH